ncbi:MAG: hypothetical protein E6Q95_01245 [Chitinophagaceae bacterium]|nr:MAG: hypothetical protein E6Q95_01245 [Chitinophagaceae bacterium]
MNSSNRLKNNVLFLPLIFSFLHFSTNIQAQNSKDTLENQLTVQAQFRPKFELRAGAFKPLSSNDKPAALISERFRLTADYSYKDILSLRISPQSVGIWGQANMVQGVEYSGNKIALFEAWTQLKLSNNWNVKLGRQVISLDDERFFGELDWAQGGRAHDAVALQFKKSKFEFKSYLAFNQNYKAIYNNNSSNPSGNLYNTTDAFPYKNMQTLWMSTPISKHSKLTALFTNLGLQNAASANVDADLNYTQTFGANLFHASEAFNGNVSAYYQTGKNITGTKTQAYLIAAAAGVTINKQWNMGTGSDLVSGNDVGKASNTNKAFNPYFHTGHKFYGFMDYFYVGNSHKNAGLSDTYLKLNYKSQKGLLLNMAFHQFYTPNHVLEGTKEYSKNLGQELDLTFGYKLNKFTNFSGGYSFYVTSPTINYLKTTPNAKDLQQWFWLSLNINPTIFKNNF